MRAENDRVIAAQMGYELADFDNLLRVKADRRLVEDKQLGVADKRLSDTDALLIAL